VWVAVHYAEIALKGKNRPRFEQTLSENLARALGPIGQGRVGIRSLYGRLLVELPDGTPFESARQRMERVFGIAYFGRVTVCEPSLEAIGKAAEALASDRGAKTFGIRARRADKHHPFTSSDLAREVGARVGRSTGARVDLSDPELWIEIHVLSREALLFHERCRGPGGLPTSSAGRAVALISGGIDSPVASYLAMKRGCTLDFVHFHSIPYTSAGSIEKVRDLVSLLARCQGSSSLHLVPFGELQQTLVREAPAEPRIVLYRRFMLRISESVARRIGGLALITGESLGQVSSQTLANLDTINRAATLPVLRPLIGMDKVEIVEAAKQIGTYEISIEPDEDCCSYLMPSRPATWARPGSLDAIERNLDVAGLVESAVQKIETDRVEPRE
jgi:thiamine biosynthesis protein ThiI